MKKKEKCVNGMQVRKQGLGWGSASQTLYLVMQRTRIYQCVYGVCVWGGGGGHKLRTGQIHAEG